MNTYKKLVVVLLILGFVFMLNQFDAFGLSKVTDTLIQGIKTAAKRVSRVFVKKQDTVNMQEKVAQEFPELEEVEDIPGIQQKAKKKNLSKDLIEQLSKDRVEDAITTDKNFDEPFTHPFSKEYSEGILPEGGTESEESENWDGFMQYLMDGIYVSPYEEWFKQLENEKSEEDLPLPEEEYPLDELLEDIEKDAFSEWKSFLLEELELTE